jgi:hypothetical protein
MWASFFATVHQGSLVYNRTVLFMTSQCDEGLARYSNKDVIRVIHEIETEVTARRQWASGCRRAWICAVVS